MQRLVVLVKFATAVLVVAFTGAAGWNILFSHGPRPSEQTAAPAFDTPFDDGSLIRRSVRPSTPAPPVAVRSQQVLTAQRHLARLGLYRGRPDGLAGPATRAALRAFQERVGLPRTGRIDQATLDRLRYELYLRDLIGDTGSVARR